MITNIFIWSYRYSSECIRYCVTQSLSPNKLLECGFEARGLGKLWVPQVLPGLQ